MSFFPKSKTDKLVACTLSFIVIFGLAIPTINLWISYFNKINDNDPVNEFSKNYSAEIKVKFPKVLKLYGTTVDDYKMGVLYMEDFDQDRFSEWVHGINSKFQLSYHKIK